MFSLLPTAFLFPNAQRYPKMASNESTAPADPTARLPGDDGEDRIDSAFDLSRGVLRGSGETHWETNPARQKARLQGWAENLGFFLNPEEIFPRCERGGPEHDRWFEESRDRLVKPIRGDGVIPVQPDGGFLDFIRDTLARGVSLSVVRTTHTTNRALT
jgi:hypothetical protein